MIGIIDYGRGNLRSVEKAFAQVGFESKILVDPSELKQVQGIILPGVGAFADAMQSLNSGGWVEPVREYARSGKPFLGICLGMQLLFEVGEEHGEHHGLGLLPGRVVKFPPGRKVPHMGWNELQIARSDFLLEGIPEGAYFYFVHSYYVQPADRIQNRTTDRTNGGTKDEIYDGTNDGSKDVIKHGTEKGARDRSSCEDIILATSDYGVAFPALVGQGNIWGAQFHPEKSSAWGLKLLENFGKRVSEYADITSD